MSRQKEHEVGSSGEAGVAHALSNKANEVELMHVLGMRHRVFYRHVFELRGLFAKMSPERSKTVDICHSNRISSVNVRDHRAALGVTIQDQRNFPLTLPMTKIPGH